MYLFSQITKLLAALGVSKSQTLYVYAYSQIGTSKSGILAPIEYGCAEAVNRVFHECFGSDAGGGVSTMAEYQSLLKDARFIQVTDPLPGDILVSPTGYGHGSLPNGHTGIVSDGGKIMSNDSNTGLWEENYTLDSWKARYVTLGGYPMAYFRVIL